MTELSAAARVLGVDSPAHPLESDVEYLSLVARGFPVKALDRIANEVAPGDVKFKYRIVPKASYARSKVTRRLSASQSVLVTRIASVWAQALRIWKSEEAARSFLGRSHPVLGSRKPIDLVLENEIGADLVRGVLGRLENGSAV
jgi:putative toxin-antitoxin system antitoxin component (TIGR02293 family)